MNLTTITVVEDLKILKKKEVDEAVGDGGERWVCGGYRSTKMRWQAVLDNGEIERELEVWVSMELSRLSTAFERRKRGRHSR